MEATAVAPNTYHSLAALAEYASLTCRYLWSAAQALAALDDPQEARRLADVQREAREVDDALHAALADGTVTREEVWGVLAEAQDVRAVLQDLVAYNDECEDPLHEQAAAYVARARGHSAPMSMAADRALAAADNRGNGGRRVDALGHLYLPPVVPRGQLILLEG